MQWRIICFPHIQTCSVSSACAGFDVMRQALGCNSEPIPNHTDSLGGGGGAGGYNYRSKGGCIITGARHVYCRCVWRKALGIYWFTGGLSCGEKKKIRPDTIRSQSFIAKLQKVMQGEGNLVDHILPCNPVFMTVAEANINRAAWTHTWLSEFWLQAESVRNILQPLNVELKLFFWLHSFLTFN